MIAREVIAGLVPEIGLDAEVAKKEYRPTPETMKKHEETRNAVSYTHLTLPTTPYV